MADAGLKNKSAGIISRILPKIENLMDEKKITIESDLFNQITSFLDELERISSPALKVDIRKARNDLTSGELFNGSSGLF